MEIRYETAITAESLSDILHSCAKYINEPDDVRDLNNKADKLMANYLKQFNSKNTQKKLEANHSLSAFLSALRKFLEDHQTYKSGSYLIPNKNKYPEIAQIDTMTSNLNKEYLVMNSLNKLIT